MFQRDDALRREDALALGLGRPVRVESGVCCRVQGVNEKGLLQQGQWGQRGGDRGTDGTTSPATGRSTSLSSARPCLMRPAGVRPSHKPRRSSTDPGVPVCSSPRPGSPGAQPHQSSWKSLRAHLRREGEVSEGQADAREWSPSTAPLGKFLQGLLFL